jgi:hypothetical protein
LQDVSLPLMVLVLVLVLPCYCWLAWPFFLWQEPILVKHLTMKETH